MTLNQFKILLYDNKVFNINLCIKQKHNSIKLSKCKFTKQKHKKLDKALEIFKFV